MLLTIILLIIGFAFLVKGANFLVDGASELAEALGVSQFLIGLTVVAIGTSLPELATASYAAFLGNTDLTVGNVIGSNITNIALILGAAALIGGTMKIKAHIAQRDIVLLIGSAFICVPILLGGVVSRYAGLILLIIISAYILDTIAEYRMKNYKKKKKKKCKVHLKNIAFILIGCIGVVVGAHLTITSAIEIANIFNITDRIIGLTLVALGTSLPELATAITAALKKKGAMVIGNIAGSNAFNILGVLGFSAVIRSLPVNPLILAIDLPVMLIASLFFIFIWDRDVTRFEGLVLLSFYVVYLFVLLL